MGIILIRSDHRDKYRHDPAGRRHFAVESACAKEHKLAGLVSESDGQIYSPG
jgi:hypothetical protein